MIRLVPVLCIFVVTSSGLLYIERCAVKSTPYMAITVNYTHDSRGNSITNVTLSDSVTIKKIVLYIIIRAAESDHDREYKTTVLWTVGDAEKSYKNLNSNLFMKGFMANIIRTMDFEFKFPLLPVRIHSK